MSETGKLVCHDAECECQFGSAPDTLVVTTQNKRFINDAQGSGKLIATHKDIGQPFQKKTFGPCKMQPTPAGYNPCQPVITQWQNYYTNVTLAENGGNPLLEGSKAICAIAGSPCVSITFHGQTAQPGENNFKQEEQEEDTASQINPLVQSQAVTEPIDPKINASKL